MQAGKQAKDLHDFVPARLKEPNPPSISREPATGSKPSSTAELAERFNREAERRIAFRSHLLGLLIMPIPFGNVLFPWLYWRKHRKRSSFVGHHCRASLNFQCTITLVVVAMMAIGCLVGIVTPPTAEGGLPPLVAVLIMPFAFGVPILFAISCFSIFRSAESARTGEESHYPFAYRFFT